MQLTEVKFVKSSDLFLGIEDLWDFWNVDVGYPSWSYGDNVHSLVTLDTFTDIFDELEDNHELSALVDQFYDRIENMKDEDLVDLEQ